jgi:mycoredoxin
MGMTAVKVYGTDWCGDTQETLSHLDRLGVKYQYVNIDDDEKAAAWVRHQNDGKEKKPTIDIGGIILSEPSESDLDIALKENRLL